MGSVKKILIAEDELLIAKVLKMQLEKLGFAVENVTDADSAFKRALETKPDIIILDINLKNKSSGIEAGKSIRGAGINTPLIFTTGNSYDATLLQVAEMGNCSLLTKPVEIEFLIETINKYKI